MSIQQTQMTDMPKVAEDYSQLPSRAIGNFMLAAATPKGSALQTYVNTVTAMSIRHPLIPLYGSPIRPAQDQRPAATNKAANEDKKADGKKADEKKAERKKPEKKDKEKSTSSSKPIESAATVTTAADTASEAPVPQIAQSMPQEGEPGYDPVTAVDYEEEEE